jgi:hypothetical protein
LADRHSSHIPSSSTFSAAAATAGEGFTAAQVALIRQDMESMTDLYLEVADDKVAELLQFFNKAVSSILDVGSFCEPKAINDLLIQRFPMTVWKPKVA